MSRDPVYGFSKGFSKGLLKDSYEDSKDSLGAPLTIVRRRIRILPLDVYENL